MESKIQQIFKNLSYPIQFVTYKGIVNEITNDTINDVIEFYKQNFRDKFIKIKPHNAYYTKALFEVWLADAHTKRESCNVAAASPIWG